MFMPKLLIEFAVNRNLSKYSVRIPSIDIAIMFDPIAARKENVTNNIQAFHTKADVNKPSVNIIPPIIAIVRNDQILNRGPSSGLVKKRSPENIENIQPVSVVVSSNLSCTWMYHFNIHTSTAK